MINQYGVLSAEHQQVIEDASKLLFTQIRLHMDDMELDQAAIFMLELQVCILGHLGTYKLHRATLKRKQAAEASKQTTERVCVQLLEEGDLIMHENKVYKMTSRYHDAFQGTTTVYFYRTGLPTLGEPRRTFYNPLTLPNSRNCWVNKVKRNDDKSSPKRYTHYNKKGN